MLLVLLLPISLLILQDTFRSLTNSPTSTSWLQLVAEKCPKSVILAIVGNKCDLTENRKVGPLVWFAIPYLLGDTPYCKEWVYLYTILKLVHVRLTQIRLFAVHTHTHTHTHTHASMYVFKLMSFCLLWSTVLRCNLKMEWN